MPTIQHSKFKNQHSYSGAYFKFYSMKYLIVSDIHGSLPALEQVLRVYEEEHCEMMLILGDILNYGPRNRIPEGIDPKGIADRLNAMKENIVAVRGNCDSEVDQMLLQFPVLSTYAVVVDNGRRLFLTHGHVFNEENQPACKHDFFFYGHTHLWKLEQDDNGQVVCNTGSVTFPKGGNEPTFAIYEDGHVEMRSLDGSVVKKL